MAGSAIDSEKNGHQFTLRPRGRLDRTTVGVLWPESKGKIKSTAAGQITIDLREITGLDSSGVAYLKCVQSLCEQKGIRYEERNVPEEYKEFLTYTRKRSGARLEEEAPSPRPGFITMVGLKTEKKAIDLWQAIGLFGQFVQAFVGRILDPKEFHLREVLYHLQASGFSAVPLIAALSFLLGMEIVFENAGEVSMMGSNVLVADMVVMAVTREMAPLVVAVVVAGRSGSAFAAEIGAMKVNDELDALTVMNLDVLRLIVLPRVFALAIAVPILTMIGDVVGIMAGCFTSTFHLGVSVQAFMNEARGALTATDLYTGLIKAVPFGVVTGYIGCVSGLSAAKSPDSIGIQTTAAVVKSIFAVILIDTVTSYIFSLYNW